MASDLYPPCVCGHPWNWHQHAADSRTTHCSSEGECVGCFAYHPQPDAARWIASNMPCLGCLHQYVSHRRDFGECALCGCVSFKNPEDQPEPAPPSVYAGFDEWWRVAFAHTKADPFPASEAWREATKAAQRQHAAEREQDRAALEAITAERDRWKAAVDAVDLEALTLEQIELFLAGGAEQGVRVIEPVQWTRMLHVVREQAAALEAARAEAARLREALERFYADSCDCWRAVEQKCHWCEAPAGEKHADDCPWPQGFAALAAATPAAPPDPGVGQPAYMKLNQWGLLLFHAFDEHPYLVGSALNGKAWNGRDVDVRLILDDERFDALFPPAQGHVRGDETHGLWQAMCTAFAVWGREFTGLPIDFQIQQRSDANRLYPGASRRSALGIIFHTEPHAPGADQEPAGGQQ